jgi:hypothetical protein
MEATNTQQKALAYFSEQLKKAEAWLQERNKVFEKELSAESQRMTDDGVVFPTITAMMNVGMRNNIEQTRMYYEYAENLSRYVYKLQHLDSSKAQEYLHRQSIEHRDMVKLYNTRIKELLKNKHKVVSLATSLAEVIACQRACEKLADDFAKASQL